MNKEDNQDKQEIKISHLIIVGLVIAGLYISVKPTLPDNNTTVSETNVDMDPIQQIERGEEGVFSETAYLASTETNFDRMNDLALARDEAGLYQMEFDGLISVIPAGTGYRVIDVKYGKREVRLTSGDQAGESGWVSI